MFVLYLRFLVNSTDMEKHTVSRLVGAPPGYGEHRVFLYINTNLFLG